MHEAEPCAEILPLMQCEQNDMPVLLWKSPALHGVQIDAVVDVVYLPASHLAQARLL